MQAYRFSCNDITGVCNSLVSKSNPTDMLFVVLSLEYRMSGNLQITQLVFNEVTSLPPWHLMLSKNDKHRG